MNIRCAKHLFVTAILTGPRARRTGTRDGVKLEGPSPHQGSTSWLGQHRLTEGGAITLAFRRMTKLCAMLLSSDASSCSPQSAAERTGERD